ncbi:hypothetical protein RJ641_016325, partial [Dillenia turbinata]
MTYSEGTIRRALNLVVNVKMITACFEGCSVSSPLFSKRNRTLSWNGNQYVPFVSSIRGGKDCNNLSFACELIEKADGFAGVFPGTPIWLNFSIVGTHCGDGVNDALALEKADISIADAYATDAARGASNVDLTEP